MRPVRALAPCLPVTLLVALAAAAPAVAGGGRQWSGYGRDPQHSAQSSVASDPLNRIKWQTSVDLAPLIIGGDLLIHYGSPMITAHRTVVVPVKTGLTDNFRVEGHDASDGSTRFIQNTGYHVPPHDWMPSFPATLDPRGRLYLADSGGTLQYRDNVDSPPRARTGQLAFYGIANYQANPAAYDSTVFISTPLTSDTAGNLYFGFIVTGGNPSGLQSGLARLSAAGDGTWTSAATASGDAAMVEVPHDSAPALSHDGSTVYVAVSNGGAGYLLALDAATLAPKGRVRLLDPGTGLDASLSDDSSASPVVGPDGEVYYGVNENPGFYHHGRGWLLHYDSTLVKTRPPGSFGWDCTPSIVPARAVASYQGPSTYLLASKYNDYIGFGGTGQNRIAILDPNTTQPDAFAPATVMAEVMTAVGPTPDAGGGVREWCINSAAVDPASKCVLANSEDGVLYRWDLTTGTLSQSLRLTPGLGEAYTPTAVGPDGTVYAINDGSLFAVGK